MACEIQIVTRNRLVGRWVSSFKIPRVTFTTPSKSRRIWSSARGE